MNKRTILLLVAGLLSLPAIAHTGHAGDGLGSGFMHPFLGLDHLLAMVVVGIWSVLHSRRVWLAPLIFVSFLALGAILGHGGLVVPQLEPLVAASVLVLGLMLTLPLGRATSAPLAVIAAFALCHGMAHGGELGAAGSVLAGIVLGSAVLHGTGMLLARQVLQQRETWTRRLGQAVALVGGALLINTLL
ncbi:MAG: HupE/UreJ family protein [Candidatus Accumulibacter sp. UW26]|jgi:urease accessory protein